MLDPYNTQDEPFLCQALNAKANRLVIIPMGSFHRLADEIGDPKC